MGSSKKCLLGFAISLIIIFSFISVVHAVMDVSFAWDANSEPDVVGYYFYYKTGSSGPPYDGMDALEGESPIYVAGRTNTTLTLTGLSETEDYYFAVTAYDSEDLESGYSVEVVKYAEPPQYTLTVNSSGQGSVTPSGGTYDEGSEVELTASPASGWTFDHWGGDVTGSTNPVSITMNTDKTVTAYFTEDNVAPFILGYPGINRAQRTIDVTYSEDHMQNAAVEANYTFNPSLNFATTGNDITFIGANTYRLAMASIPSYTIFVLTVNNITDAVGHLVTPNSVRINDNDNDDMADDWENDYGVNHPTLDPDSDGLNNLKEYENLTDPFDSDTDNDGLPDGWEVIYGLDPNNATGVNGGDGDIDNDGWTNSEEYAGGTDPSDDTSTPELTPPKIIETSPHNGAGIIDNTRIANDASFAIYIEDADGIDLTDFSSIVFTINDGVNPPYSLDLGDTSIVRTIKLTNDDSAQVTKLWVVYDRVNDIYGPYPFDGDVNIKVDAKDRREAWMTQASFDFNIESSDEHNNAQLGMPASVPVDSGDPDLEDPYDAGIMISNGELYGAKILYDNDEPVKPRFGPIHEISKLHVSGAGAPINLQPPTVFNVPVKIFIPYDGYDDIAAVSVYVNKGKKWVLACDGNGDVQPGGDGWMVPGSWVNHSDKSPAKIEIKVYHFTAVQTGAAFDGPTETDTFDESDESGGSCFIDTAASGLP